MERIILNGNHLKNSDIQKRISKSRCIFIDERNRLLVERVEDFYVLPGGKLELKENFDEALIREIEEEVGLILRKRDIMPVFDIHSYQKAYVNRDGSKINRFVQTRYYIADKASEVTYCLRQLGNDTNLEKINVFDLERYILTHKFISNNHKFFNEELISVINVMDINLGLSRKLKR